MSEGRPKMRLRVRGVSNRLWNEELASVPKEERLWGISRYVSLWTAVSVSIPTYMLASGLIVAGMSWKQALGTILLGNLIVLVAMVLNSVAGAKYGIPFPVYLRASFGVLGANVPAVLKALVSCGWFGIQCWIGGMALFAMVKAVAPSIDERIVWTCFGAFWLLNLLVASRKVEAVKSLQMVSLPLMLIVGLGLMFWMVGRAGGLSVALGSVGVFHGSGGAVGFWKIFLPSLTASVGLSCAFALGVSDFSRYARSQKTQAMGQAAGLVAGMMLYSFLGVAATAAAMTVFPDPRAIWNPIDLIASIRQPALELAGLAMVLVATLGSNTVLSLSGAAMTFANLRPNRISQRAGELIAGWLALGFMPWRVMASPESYLGGWLVGCSGVMGPIAGVMITDYFVVRRRSLNVDELYVRGGVYEYSEGFNWRALIALAAGIAAALAGIFVPELHWLYEAAWFVGFAVSAALYLMLMNGPDVAAMIPPNPLLIKAEGFGVEGFSAEPSA